MTEFSGARTSADSATETRQVRYVHERIFLYAPQYTPILMLKGGVMPGPNGERVKVKGLIKSKFTPAKKVEWFDKILPNLLAYAEGATGTGTTFDIDDGSSAAHPGIAAGVLLQIGGSDALPEIVFVVSVSTRTATVVRSVGDSKAATNWADDTEIHIIGNAREENSPIGTGRGVLANPLENYMEISRHDWALSRSEDKIRLYGGKSKAETMAEAAVEHVRELERKMTLGFRANSGLTLDSKNVQTMGGLRDPSFNDGMYLAAGTSTGRFVGLNHGGGIDYAEMFETFIPECFKYSSPRKRKIFIGGGIFGKVFNRFSTNQGNIQTYVRDTAFGVTVTELISHAGTIEFLTSGALEESQSTQGFCFDPEFLEFDYVDNTFMVDNAQPKGTDGFAGYFITEATMKYEAIKTILGISGVTGWVPES